MRVRNYEWLLVVWVLVLLPAACGDGRPGADGLLESFAGQLSAIPGVSNVRRNGQEITFNGPAADGGAGTWRIQVDSTEIEPNDDPSLPFKGTVTSSWYSNGRLVQPSGRESKLPVELTSNGLAQSCWALWNQESARWEWE